MDPLFLNYCSLTKKNLTEEACKNRGTALWVLLILGAVYFCAAAVTVILNGGVFGWIFGGIIAVLTVLYGVFVLFAPQLNSAKRAKRNQARYGNAMRTVYSFYDETLHIDCISNGKARDLPYEKIQTVEQTKHLILLCTDQASYPLSKTGFRKGDLDTFTDFICEKAVQAKIEL